MKKMDSTCSRQIRVSYSPVPIPFSAERRKQMKEETTDQEKSALRGGLGAKNRKQNAEWAEQEKKVQEPERPLKNRKLESHLHEKKNKKLKKEALRPSLGLWQSGATKVAVTT